MSEADSPVNGSGNDTALSFDDGAAAIANLLPDVPEEDSTEAVESQTADQDKPQSEADDDLVLNDDETGSDDEAPATEFSGGKFASHDAKVKLEDGSTISVKDLLTNNMFQRTFTEKTTALAKEKEAFEADRGQITEYARQLASERELIMALANEFIPQPPDITLMETDPFSYMQQKAAHEAQMEKIHKLHQGREREAEQLTAKQQEDLKKSLASETAKLLEVIPEFKDGKRFEQFRNEALEIGQSIYGVTPQEIGSVTDHRFIHILKDAVAYRKAIAKRDASKVVIEQKPKLVPKQRMAPASSNARDYQQAKTALLNSGSLDDGAKALEKLLFKS